MRRAAVPARGDLGFLSFDPQAGHEQMGRRPALVVSNQAFSRATGMAIVCPITSTDRGVPFHVAVPDGAGITGFIMVEQVKAVDVAARGWKRIGQVPQEALEEVLAILDACVE